MRVNDFLQQYSERKDHADDRAAALNLLKCASSALTEIVKTNMSTDTAIAAVRALTEMARVHAILDAAQDPR